MTMTVAEFTAGLERLWYPLFPWHQQQRLALAACTDVIMICGGNQSGKSAVGAGIVGRLIRRDGPIYARLKNPHRPLKVWVGPLTSEKWKSNWETRLLTDVCAGMGVTYVQSPHPVITWQDAYGGGQIWGKSQDQGFLAFESDAVDLIVLDEEPEDRRLYTSCLTRFATTNGTLVLAFTPLRGMDWTHAQIYEPSTKPEYKRGDRVWKTSPKGSTDGVTVIQMGMADNPAAVDGARRIREDPAIAEQEKRTRLYGEYGFVEGLLFPQFQDLKPYYLPSLPQNRPYSWVLTIDPNKRHAGLLTALDHEGNRYYVAEHFATDKPDSYHAEQYLGLLAKWQCRNATIAADPGGAGAQSIINLAERGVFAAPVPKDAGSVKASIDLVNRAAWVDPWHLHPTDMNDRGARKLGAPHCYFLGSLFTSSWEGHANDSRLVWEVQRYRQKPNSPPGTPIKQDDDLTDCLRYLELVRPFSPEEPDQRAVVLRERLDELSYRESQDSAVVMTKAVQGRRRVKSDLDFDVGVEVDLT